MNKQISVKKRGVSIGDTVESLTRLKAALISEIEGDPRSERADIRDAGMDSGDLASEEYENEVRILLARRGRSRIAEIDDALKRIDQANYGMCETCGLEIGAQRLKAMPFTRHCCDCQGNQERAARTQRRSDDTNQIRGEEIAATVAEDELNDKQVWGRGMKQILSVVVMIAIATLLAGISCAQVGGDNARVNRGVVSGNTTVVFEAANDSDLPMASLERWSRFAQEHPKIARQLANKPRLVDNAGYLRKHQALKKLFEDNPDLFAQMKRNPGDFVANQARSQ